ASTNRLRTEGTQYLLEAAQAAGVPRFVAESYTGFPNIREGGRVKTEDDPLDLNPPESMRQTFAAIRQLEAMVTSADDIEGIVLPSEIFEGRGPPFALGGEIVDLTRHYSYPFWGGGAGVWSFINMDEAGATTGVAGEGAPAAIYNIVDDDPA